MVGMLIFLSEVRGLDCRRTWLFNAKMESVKEMQVCWGSSADIVILHIVNVKSFAFFNDKELYTVKELYLGSKIIIDPCNR